MDNELVLFYEASDQAGPGQQGPEQVLGNHEAPNIDRASSVAREPEADFLQGDSYPGRNHFERR